MLCSLGDLIGFKGHLNESSPFTVEEHEVQWKNSRRYLDFDIGNTYNETCEYPVFWYEDGNQVNQSVYDSLVGCYDSDFDQYGDVEAFGVFPDWQRQLSKFASVQDRLREWYDPVLQRLERFSCMTIAALDIDGFRVDKAMQVTVDAQASFASKMRECAREYNKTNFMLVGEITAGNTLGSIWLGRGRSKDLWMDDLTQAETLASVWNDSSSSEYFLRDPGNSALDAGAFHYSIYRTLTRFLGMSGNLEAGYDLPLNWVEMWNEMILSNDFYNANTGEFDPRHLYGVANQDVFRWPGVTQGTQRQMLGYMVTTFLLPGIPLVYYGEEQDLYLVDSTAANYVFGRQAFSPSQAWMKHGCYTLGSTIYQNFPAEKLMTGCTDPSQALDHRDPSAPLRNTMKHMFSLRDSFPVLEGGWLLSQLSNQTSYRLLNGSSSATEFGIWSVVRTYNTQTQTDVTANDTTPVWMVYHNQNETTTYTFDCATSGADFLSPFDSGKVVRNLMNSTEGTYTLEDSSVVNTNWTGTTNKAGCFSSLTMAPYEFKVFVPAVDYVAPGPMITHFSPGHDFQIDSSVNTTGEMELVLGFSTEMDCTLVSSAISVQSWVDGTGAQNLTTLGEATCTTVDADAGDFVGYIPTIFTWTATLSGIADGIHKITVTNASTADGAVTNAVDHFFLRQGLPDNPVVFPERANHSTSLVTVNDNEIFSVKHRAPGATQWRYSTNWGSSWSSWKTYEGSASDGTITTLTWSGTDAQAWDGYHLTVQYYSQPLGSSAFVQHGDYGVDHQRQFPHIFLNGDYNDWGFDSGTPAGMSLKSNSTWSKHFMYEWPAQVQVNIWGMNPDGEADATFIYGDVDGDGVLDRLAPSSLAENVLNMTSAPAWPYLAYTIILDDQQWTIKAVPAGSAPLQVFLFWLLAVTPIITAALAGWIYVQGFYQVKVNKVGFKRKPKMFISLNGLLHPNGQGDEKKSIALRAISPSSSAAVAKAPGEKRTVLIATMEYNVDDWNISIKIGGLGVMAKLMSASLDHVNLIWVVPCIGGIDYPMDEPAESMFVNIMGESYEVHVQYHRVKNITYVLLDAPIFRQQTKAEPYIARMDDIESGILYAAWNSCIAEAIRRFNVDIYHINDYHGAIAPLYLLPQVIPVCLSLHNAEFQGLWPMRTPEESKEVCEVFGLPMEVVKKYVQYGTVFNLLHAGASYLRYHQKGFGAVGVSKKYGDRSLARYPIFWSLKNIGQLPNPDPSDTAAWEPDKDALVSSKEGITVDQAFEAARGDLRVKAQEWAGLEIDPTAELFVFVGRWSLQKGVDLIADIFPSILEKYPKTQLIAVGPVIDLYGKFAALKLAKLMEKYPKRVFSKPEFTQLPPYIFSGAEFALIPSRDEPFGLVAVEFGRKGALGVGARVGGLGQMPGFWFTVESMTPAHLLDQFQHAMTQALKCKPAKRALMRAWSAKQRFPVKQWIHQIDCLYDESIRISYKEAAKGKKNLTSRSAVSLNTYSNDAYQPDTPGGSRPSTPGLKVEISSPALVRSSLMHHQSPEGSPHPSSGLMSPGLMSPGLPSPGLAPGGARGSYMSTMSTASQDNLASGGLMTPKFPWKNLEPGSRASTASFDSFAMRAQDESGMPTSPGFANDDNRDSVAGLPLPKPSFYQAGGNRNSSQLSLSDVVGERHDMKLQKVDLSFTDANGEFYAEFEDMLASITAKNSHTELCIEEFLKKSEKEWFKRYRNAKLGIESRDASRTRSKSPFGRRPDSQDGKMRDSSVVSRGRQRHRSITPHSTMTYMSTEAGSPYEPDQDDEFLLGRDFKAPTGLRK
ncbi:unnamed protein product [Discula destructiva]